MDPTTDSRQVAGRGDAMKTFGSLLLALSMAACGGEAISGADPETTPAAGGSGAIGGTGATGGATAGTGAATGSTGGASSGGSAGAGAACVPQENVSWPPLEPACEHLWVLDVSNPTLTDPDGDGVVSPGDTIMIHVDLAEVAGYGWNMYPGVEFTSDHPGVSVTWNDWYYAIFACQTHAAGATVIVGNDVAPGSHVTITARVAMLGSECPSANAIQIPLTIQ
jgi:hypothetical protein